MSINIFDIRPRKTHRAPVNQMDKTTIVSIYPKNVPSHNSTIFPGDFLIPAGTYDKPTVLTVGSSSWWKDMEGDQDPFEVVVGSILVADSIVKDWARGLMGCNLEDSMPGLFYIEGTKTSEEVKKNHKNLLDLAAAKQKKYYETLIELGDVLWVSFQGSPRTISEDMRLAATELGIKDKAWMKDSVDFRMQNCPACGNLRNPAYPICPNCKTVIDKDKAKLIGIPVG